MSRCIRSWPPLSCGWPGRENTTSMPSDAHQAESHVNPPLALVHPNGVPLSLWIVRGSPYFSKRRINTACTGSPLVECNHSTANTNRECASRTVNGSHRAPSAVRHHPLKSTVHRSLGASTTTFGANRVLLRMVLARFRPRDSPARSRIRAIVLIDGTSARGSRLTSVSWIFLGPHRGCSLRRRITATA